MFDGHQPRNCGQGTQQASHSPIASSALLRWQPKRSGVTLTLLSTVPTAQARRLLLDQLQFPSNSFRRNFILGVGVFSTSVFPQPFSDTIGANPKFRACYLHGRDDGISHRPRPARTSSTLQETKGPENLASPHRCTRRLLSGSTRASHHMVPSTPLFIVRSGQVDIVAPLGGPRPIGSIWLLAAPSHPPACTDIPSAQGCRKGRPLPSLQPAV